MRTFVSHFNKTMRCETGTKMLSTVRQDTILHVIVLYLIFHVINIFQTVKYSARRWPECLQRLFTFSSVFAKGTNFFQCAFQTECQKENKGRFSTITINRFSIYNCVRINVRYVYILYIMVLFWNICYVKISKTIDML